MAELGEVALGDPVEIAIQLHTQRPVVFDAADAGQPRAHDLVGVRLQAHRCLAGDLGLAGEQVGEADSRLGQAALGEAEGAHAHGHDAATPRVRRRLNP
jgi:hypothetical protein